ncbi:hypothetical protein EAH_00045050, partial [Eimeria acervulina]
MLRLTDISAGGGLGRAYALAFARRGAKVVVNDLGVALAGDANKEEGIRAADAVVEEIKSFGGEATANYDDVLNGDKIIEAAIKAFGQIDILINNAGILRDSSFAKLTEQDWDRVMQVHLKGAFLCTKAAWSFMMKRRFGRIINTTSASGTRMTADVLPPPLLKSLKPDCVAPVVLFLSSKESKVTGQVFEVGAGWVAAVRWQRSAGKVFSSAFSLEDLQRDWHHVVDFNSNVSYPTSLADSLVMASQQMSTGTEQQQQQQQQQPQQQQQQQQQQTEQQKVG